MLGIGLRGGVRGNAISDETKEEEKEKRLFGEYIMLNAGKISFSVQCFKELLHFKEDWNILGIKVGEDYNDKDKIFIAVSGSDLPEVQPGELIPEVDIIVNKIFLEVRKK